MARAAALGGLEKSDYVRRIFSEIAPRYDLLNHLLSMNIDRRWRRLALRELAWTQRPRGLYLDLCAGTLDVAALLASQAGFGGTVIGADFAEPMLRAGQSKLVSGAVLPVASDALELPIADGAAAGAIVAFGLRNVADVDAALAEVWRVLSPGGKFLILDFSTPPAAIVRAIYNVYFHHVVPAVGGVVSGQSTAYRYLPESVANFPAPEALASRMERAGFSGVSWRRLTFGIAAIHVGVRP